MLKRRNAIILLMLLLVTAALLSGCGGAGSRVSAAGNSGEALSISFATTPEKLLSSGSSTLSLDIKEKDKAVVGAAVIFEIWPKGQEQHAQLNAKSEGKGQYYIKGEFSQLGDYYLLAHVTTAEGVHQMKTFEFSIQ
ncbi:FixH family protein [Cohnella abietis]|uniref:YtkA-like domain-containing protein n=1 Tax=Cohnella abietis TaxID=2507935 RepID=A0A3T1D0K2_9BACL|nr:FixH family protein [Cohnella abietis]BBI31630.1 hypothetical protein KCTCHS21_10290 [Cohnella abietis]